MCQEEDSAAMNNPNFVQLIRKIADEVIEYKKPADYYVATVVSVKPLKIKIGRKLAIEDDFITMTEIASSRKLQKGNKVAVIRKWGGQHYLIIDRIK